MSSLGFLAGVAIPNDSIGPSIWRPQTSASRFASLTDRVGHQEVSENLKIIKENASDDINDFADGYKGARILILGASGFIGRWTARKLTASGAELFLAVREISAARTVFDDYAIEGKVCKADLLDTRGISELIRQIHPAVVFDLAGYGVDRTENAKDIAYQTNAQLPEVLCGAMAESRVFNWSGQRIIRAGSAMEYGAAFGNLEETTVPRPTTLYGKSKCAGTRNLANSCRRFGLKGLTARLFSVYGAGENTARLLPTLIRARGSEKPIKLTAGTHDRDFIYVEDAAEGLLRLGLTSTNTDDVVNLATGVLTSVRCFTETAADELGIERVRLRFGALPTRPEEMRHEPTSIGRLGNLTGWRPRTTIAEGVRKTLAFF